jgi:uncharacterized RDD family membrane protein YckC
VTRYQIVTPERVSFHYETAGYVSRVMAWVFDQVIMLVIRALLFYSFSGLEEMGWTLILLGMFAVDFGYYLYFELYWAGQSPGKRKYHIRVISSTGGKLRFADVLIRNLVRTLDGLPFLMVVGGVTAFIDPLSRRLGDMAADTLVVVDATVTAPEIMLKRRGRENSFEADAVVRNRILARATRQERDLFLDLMARGDEIDPLVREELFGEAAEYCRGRFALPEGLDHLSDEQTVLNVALVIQGVRFA